MDSRLIFLHHLMSVTTEGGTQEDSAGLVMVQVQAFRLVSREIRSLLRLRRDGEARKGELA
jgi:hypothetical protein